MCKFIHFTKFIQKWLLEEIIQNKPVGTTDMLPDNNGCLKAISLVASQQYNTVWQAENCCTL